MIPSELPTIVTTDDKSWKAPIYNNKHIQVEQMSAGEALDKYKLMQQEGDGEMTWPIDDRWTVPPPMDGSKKADRGVRPDWGGRRRDMRAQLDHVGQLCAWYGQW